MNALKNDRFWVACGVLGALVVAALAWFIAVGPELSNASSLDAQTADAQIENATLQVKLHKLQADNANMGALTTALEQARTALPVDTDIASYTMQLTTWAAQSHVTVTGISGSAPVSAITKPGQVAAPITSSVAGQLYALPLTVIVKGSIAADENFLKRVQATGQRAALVNGAQLTNDPGKTGTAAQLTMQLQVFVAPQSPAALAALQKQLASIPK